MKKPFSTLLLAAITFGTIFFFAFTKPAGRNLTAKQNGTGTIYIKIKNDRNRGNLHVTVRSASSTTKLFETQIAADQTAEKTLSGLPTGPQQWYVVSFDWPGTDFHNIASDGCMIASGYPATGGNTVASWQVAGTGTYGSIPILLR